MEENNANGFAAEILALIIENHSWLDFVFLYVIAYIAIPNKSKRSHGLFNVGNDYHRAKIGKISENFGVRLAALFFLMLVVVCSMCVAGIYAFFVAVGFYLIDEGFLNRGIYFNVGRMTAEGMILMVAVNFYCHAGIGYALRDDKNN